MTSGSRGAGLLAWGRLIHPFPVVLKVLACAAFATIATPGMPALAPLVSLLVAVCLINAGIGALNDYCDRDLDVRSKPSKPLVQGLVRPWHALVVGVATLATGLAATRWLPWPARVSAVVYATAGIAYDLGLKYVPAGAGRRLSWPFRCYPSGVGQPCGVGTAACAGSTRSVLRWCSASTWPTLCPTSPRIGAAVYRASRTVSVPGGRATFVLGRLPRCPSPRARRSRAAPPPRPRAARAGAVSSAALLASAILADRLGSRTDQRAALTWHFRLLALAAVPLAVGWLLALTHEQR